MPPHPFHQKIRLWKSIREKISWIFFSQFKVDKLLSKFNQASQALKHWILKTLWFCRMFVSFNRRFTFSKEFDYYDGFFRQMTCLTSNWSHIDMVAFSGILHRQDKTLRTLAISRLCLYQKIFGNANLENFSDILRCIFLFFQHRPEKSSRYPPPFIARLWANLPKMMRLHGAWLLKIRKSIAAKHVVVYRSQLSAKNILWEWWHKIEELVYFHSVYWFLLKKKLFETSMSLSTSILSLAADVVFWRSRLVQLLHVFFFTFFVLRKRWI